jgi:hypothetical protein
MITAERLREVVTYDPDTGVFRWAMRRKKASIGAVAGSQRQDGYSLIRIDYQRYYAHRLAWLYMTGEWPSVEIDHKNGDPSDNRFSNLRAATRSQNAANVKRQRNNTSGVKGVFFCAAVRKWQAKICHGKRHIFLGNFASLDAARGAYADAATRLKGEYARVEG